jgi:hypothetical protein
LEPKQSIKAAHGTNCVSLFLYEARTKQKEEAKKTRSKEK